MKKVREKHTVYFEVLEAFQKAQLCAVCELETGNVRRYLENLLYENVNDRGVRARLVRSRGFCHRHAHMLLGFGDALGTAILYQDQLRICVETLQSLQARSGSRRSRDAGESLQGEVRCPACVVQLESRRRSVETLLKWLDDPEMHKAFEGSPGLCLAHLLPILADVKDQSVREKIAAAQVRKYSALAEELAQLIRPENRDDYRTRGEPLGKEGDSWQRAVRMLVGSKEVF
jgi:hypothetical protein